jgi:hypothetical protein
VQGVGLECYIERKLFDHLIERLLGHFLLQVELLDLFAQRLQAIFLGIEGACCFTPFRPEPANCRLREICGTGAVTVVNEFQGKRGNLVEFRYQKLDLALLRRDSRKLSPFGMLSVSPSVRL